MKDELSDYELWHSEWSYQYKINEPMSIVKGDDYKRTFIVKDGMIVYERSVNDKKLVCDKRMPGTMTIEERIKQYGQETKFIRKLSKKEAFIALL